MSAVEAEQPLAYPHPVGRGYWRASALRFFRQPVPVAALCLLVLLALVGGFAHRIVPLGWNGVHLNAGWENHPPALHHGWSLWMGTDNIGRSALERTIWGLHFTLIGAFLGALAAATIGIFLGSVAALVGGVVESVVMSVADFTTTFPVLVTIIAAFAYLQPLTETKAVLVFALYMWAFVARVVRSRLTALGAETFVEAARALGASELRVLVRHLLPNAAGALIVATTSLFGQIVLIEATAEFFGFGITSLTRPTLGNLIAEASQSGIGKFNFLGLGWWTWTTPAIALVLLLVSVNLLGDGLAAALDPRSR
jgi:peptide/nickel transport system permease protein